MMEVSSEGALRDAQTPRRHRRWMPAPWKTLLPLAAGLLLAVPVFGQGLALSPNPPQIGSPQPATADPAVPRPATTPITVPLFNGLTFTDFSNKTFSYTPPAHSPKRWAKVIFVADFAVTAGRQFDRTASVFLGNANIYYGTTAEPSATVSPMWHVERDITDYSALLKTPQSGFVVLGNIVDSTYTGVISGSGYLLFYPPGPSTPPADAADVVLPLPNNSGGAALLANTSDVLTETFQFPTNVVRAYLDVITQSQIGDEFWYFGVPDNLAGELLTNGGTGFREAEITIDNAPAGVAPVYPWIYTGGIDPYLWRPIPGVQAYNFEPYRVDLTPFAALLNDGQPHSVGISVYNSNNYFLVTGVLLLYQDPVLKTVTGALTENTLTTAPNPVITTNLNVTGSEVTGPVQVTSSRKFKIKGFVNTSLGKVETELDQSVDFSNLQNFDITATTEVQNLQLSSKVSAKTTTKLLFFSQEVERDFSYPLTIDYTFNTNPDGTFTQIVSLNQGNHKKEKVSLWDIPLFSNSLSNETSPVDTLFFSPSFSVTGRQGQANTQTFKYSDTLGRHYDETVTAANGVVTSVTAGGQSGKH